MLGLEAEVALDEDEEVRELELGDRAQQGDVAADEVELALRLCAAASAARARLKKAARTFAPRERVEADDLRGAMSADLRSLGVARSMDLIMYVLYSDDQLFVRDMVTQVLREVAAEERCPELGALAEPCYHDCPQLYRCLFFFMLEAHAKFRYWVLQSPSLGLQPVCPHKAARFMQVLRADIIPRFLVNETMRPDELERELKVEYIRS